MNCHRVKLLAEDVEYFVRDCTFVGAVFCILIFGVAVEAFKDIGGSK